MINSLKYNNSLFKDIKILTMTGKDIFGSLLVIDGKIKKIFDAEDVDYEADLSKSLVEFKNKDIFVYKGYNKAVLPGLINCHTHISMTLLRNYGSDLDLFQWLNTMIWPIEGKMLSEDIAIGAKLAMLEMLRSGTTTFLDMYDFMDTVGDCILESGMRGHISKGIIKKDDPELQRQNILKVRNLIKDYHNKGDGRIKVLTGPHAIYTNDSQSLREQIEISKEFNVGLNIHLNETQLEVEGSFEKHNMYPLEYLDSLGIREVPYGVLAHMVHVNEREFNILGESKNLKAVHNPKSNLKLGSGIFNSKEYLARDLKYGLGTDGASSNNRLSMLSELNMYSLIQKGVYGDPKLAPSFATMLCGSHWGSEVLNISEEVGTLEEGKEADLIIYDLDNINAYPQNSDDYSKIVYSGEDENILLTMVQGRILYNQGEYRTLDEEKIKSEFTKRALRLYNNG